MTATKFIEADVFKGFEPDSKVWIYSSNRLLSDGESENIDQLLVSFTKEWVSHNVSLKAAGTVLNNRFIVLAVDESIENPGGCSIDKSVHFIKSIETQFGIHLFDRLTIYYQKDGEMKSFHFNELKDKIASGEISDSTKIYDSTIIKLGPLQNEFIKEAGKSWLAKFIN